MTEEMYDNIYYQLACKIGDIIYKCLERNPETYQTIADEVKDMLNDIVDDTVGEYEQLHC